MQRPSSSGFLAVGVLFATLIAFSLLPKGSGSRGPQGTPQYHVDLLPSPRKVAGTGFLGYKEACRCHLEFRYYGETQIYKLETDHDGAPSNCENGTTEWTPTIVVHTCGADCTKVKRILNSPVKHLREGAGLQRRVCEMK